MTDRDPGPVPVTHGIPIVRTFRGDDATWDAYREIVTTPIDSGEIDLVFQGNVTIVDDPAFDGASPDSLAARVPTGPHGRHACLFVYDERTETGAGLPTLAVDLCDEPGRSFRLAAPETHLVENNLTLCNMDFAEYADAAGRDPAGVFRGFG